jgi:hypothetical protein
MFYTLLLTVTRDIYIYIYIYISHVPTTIIPRYSFRQRSELDQCKVKKKFQEFVTVAQDLNTCSPRPESDVLPTAPLRY